jgi:hypothetical protein
MAEHYTKNTVAVMHFCNRCGRLTMHKVSGKRLGLCMEDHIKVKPVADKPEDEPSLF